MAYTPSNSAGEVYNDMLAYYNSLGANAQSVTGYARGTTFAQDMETAYWDGLDPLPVGYLPTGFEAWWAAQNAGSPTATTTTTSAAVLANPITATAPGSLTASAPTPAPSSFAAAEDSDEDRLRQGTGFFDATPAQGMLAATDPVADLTATGSAGAVPTGPEWIAPWITSAPDRAGFTGIGRAAYTPDDGWVDFYQHSTDDDFIDQAYVNILGSKYSPDFSTSIYGPNLNKNSYEALFTPGQYTAAADQYTQQKYGLGLDEMIDAWAFDQWQKGNTAISDMIGDPGLRSQLPAMIAEDWKSFDPELADVMAGVAGYSDKVDAHRDAMHKALLDARKGIKLKDVAAMAVRVFGPIIAPMVMPALTAALGTVGASALAGAAGSGLSAALEGGDIGRAALMGGLTGGAGAAVGGMLGDLDLGDLAPDLGETPQLDFESMYDAGYAADWAPSDFNVSPRIGGMSYALDYQPDTVRSMLGLDTSQGTAGVNFTPAPDSVTASDLLRGAVGGSASLALSPDDAGDLGGYSPEQIEGTTPPPQGLTARDVLDYAQKAYKLYGMVQQILGGDDEGRGGLPPRREGQTDAEYQEEVAVEYLGLDVKAMADAGLEPGTPEYLEYILEQADKIIAQIFGADPEALGDLGSVEDVQAALRGKTRQETQQLMRALAVRGQLGQTSFSSEAVDPFSGLLEDLGGSGGGRQRDVSAYQRGRARDVEALSGLRGDEARGYLSGLLGRNADIFGMRAARDAQMLRELLADRQDDDKRKRNTGLYDSDYRGDEWFGELESLDDKTLNMLLGRLGNDPARLQEALAMLTSAE